MDRNIEISKQILNDLEAIIAGARRDVEASGGYAANPIASILLQALLSVAAAPRMGAAPLRDLSDSLAAHARRVLAMHEVSP